MDFVVGFVTVLSWNDATQTFTREYILKVHIRSVNLIYIYEKNIVSEVDVMAISEQECVKSHLRKCIYNFIYLRKALMYSIQAGQMMPWPATLPSSMVYTEFINATHKI